MASSHRTMTTSPRYRSKKTFGGGHRGTADAVSSVGGSSIVNVTGISRSARGDSVSSNRSDLSSPEHLANYSYKERSKFRQSQSLRLRAMTMSGQSLSPPLPHPETYDDPVRANRSTSSPPESNSNHNSVVSE